MVASSDPQQNLFDRESVTAGDFSDWRRETRTIAVGGSLLAEGDAVGRRFRVGTDGPEITVVGVVGDVLHDWFQQVRYPTVYRPVTPGRAVRRRLRDAHRGRADERGWRRAPGCAAVDPDQPIIELAPMEKVVEDRTAGVTFIAKAMAMVSFIALALAVMGLYSLMAFVVSRRQQELGVRMALGATRWQVVGLATTQGVKITLAGLAIGALAAVGIGRLMESTLFGVVSSSAWQLAGLVILVALVAVAASYLPARRMARLGSDGRASHGVAPLRRPAGDRASRYGLSEAKPSRTGSRVSGGASLYLSAFSGAPGAGA